MGANSAKRDIRKLAAAAKEQRAIQMRRDGATNEQIAKELGYHDRSGVKKLIGRAIKRSEEAANDDAKSLVYFEMQRLDFDWRRTERAIDIIEKRMAAAAKAGTAQDPRANVDLCRLIEVRLKIQERRSAYKGLDAPKTTQLTGLDGGPIGVAVIKALDDEELERLAAGGRPQKRA